MPVTELAAGNADSDSGSVFTPAAAAADMPPLLPGPVSASDVANVGSVSDASVGGASLDEFLSSWAASSMDDVAAWDLDFTSASVAATGADTVMPPKVETADRGTEYGNGIMMMMGSGEQQQYQQFQQQQVSPWPVPPPSSHLSNQQAARQPPAGWQAAAPASHLSNQQVRMLPSGSGHRMQQMPASCHQQRPVRGMAPGELHHSAKGQMPGVRQTATVPFSNGMQQPQPQQYVQPAMMPHHAAQLGGHMSPGVLSHHAAQLSPGIGRPVGGPPGSHISPGIMSHHAAQVGRHVSPGIQVQQVGVPRLGGAQVLPGVQMQQVGGPRLGGVQVSPGVQVQQVGGPRLGGAQVSPGIQMQQVGGPRLGGAQVSPGVQMQQVGGPQLGGAQVGHHVSPGVQRGSQLVRHQVSPGMMSPVLLGGDELPMSNQLHSLQAMVNNQTRSLLHHHGQLNVAGPAPHHADSVINYHQQQQQQQHGGGRLHQRVAAQQRMMPAAGRQHHGSAMAHDAERGGYQPSPAAAMMHQPAPPAAVMRRPATATAAAVFCDEPLQGMLMHGHHQQASMIPGAEQLRPPAPPPPHQLSGRPAGYSSSGGMSSVLHHQSVSGPGLPSRSSSSQAQQMMTLQHGSGRHRATMYQTVGNNNSSATMALPWNHGLAQPQAARPPPPAGVHGMAMQSPPAPPPLGGGRHQLTSPAAAAGSQRDVDASIAGGVSTSLTDLDSCLSFLSDDDAFMSVTAADDDTAYHAVSTAPPAGIH